MFDPVTDFLKDWKNRDWWLDLQNKKHDYPHLPHSTFEVECVKIAIFRFVLEISLKILTMELSIPGRLIYDKIIVYDKDRSFYVENVKIKI